MNDPTSEGLRLAQLRADSKAGIRKLYWVYLSRYVFTSADTSLSAGSGRVMLTPLAGVYGDMVNTLNNGRVPLACVFDTEAEALDFARLKLEDEITRAESVLRGLQSDHAKCVTHLREKQKEVR